MTPLRIRLTILFTAIVLASWLNGLFTADAANATMGMPVYGHTLGQQMVPGYGAFQAPGPIWDPFFQQAHLGAAISWRGSSWLGTGVMPPIGLSAIQNRAMGNMIWGDVGN